MTTKDKFLLAGVMGWPIAHSRSPLIHNHWMHTLGLKGSYVPLAVEPQHLQTAVRGLHALGFAGCNVTIPHKQRLMQLVDELHESAQLIGAISCVAVREGGRLVGSNNDAIGFMRNLHQQQPQWRANDATAVVIGAGGGARAVVYGLLQAGVREVRVVNRTLENAQVLAQAFGSRVVAQPWSLRADVLQGASLVVNTTSQGMVGQGTLNLDLGQLPKNAVAADIVYAPLMTPLLIAAHARGNPICTGLGMLLHQGPLAWKAWWGIEPEVTPELEALVLASL